MFREIGYNLLTSVCDKQRLFKSFVVAGRIRQFPVYTKRYLNSAHHSIQTQPWIYTRAVSFPSRTCIRVGTKSQLCCPFMRTGVLTGVVGFPHTLWQLGCIPSRYLLSNAKGLTSGLDCKPLHFVGLTGAQPRVYIACCVQCETHVICSGLPWTWSVLPLLWNCYRNPYLCST